MIDEFGNEDLLKIKYILVTTNEEWKISEIVDKISSNSQNVYTQVKQEISSLYERFDKDQNLIDTLKESHFGLGEEEIISHIHWKFVNFDNIIEKFEIQIFSEG